jgi:hypothetical protein
MATEHCAARRRDPDAANLQPGPRCPYPSSWLLSAVRGHRFCGVCGGRRHGACRRPGSDRGALSSAPSIVERDARTATKSIIVAGVVRGSAGDQVAQARVFIARGPVPVPDIAALTDAESRFILSFPVQGSCDVACVADGYAPSSTTIEVADDRDLRVELRLTANRTGR